MVVGKHKIKLWINIEREVNKNGYVTKEQIQASASIIIKQILDSKVNKLYPPQFFLKNK